MWRETFHRTNLKKNRKKGMFIFLILFLLLLLADCSPKVGSNLLNFFIDGVPERNKDTVATSLAVITDTIKENTQAVIQPPAREVFYHTPYKERACSKCHTAETPGKINSSQEKICYACHDDFKKTYTSIHGPVAGGFCTACHAPHLSDNKNLLLRSGQELCLNCHSPDLVMTNVAHKNIGKDDCKECHDPHGGSDHSILKPVKN